MKLLKSMKSVSKIWISHWEPTETSEYQVRLSSNWAFPGQYYLRLKILFTVYFFKISSHTETPPYTHHNVYREVFQYFLFITPGGPSSGRQA